MKKIRTLRISDEIGQFGEFPDKMLIYNNLYDFRTLEPAKNYEFNVTHSNNANMYAGSKSYNSNISISIGGGLIAPSFEGRGSNRHIFERFSWNCFWQEPNNKPIYEWTDGDIYNIFMNESPTSAACGIVKYSRDCTKYYSSSYGNTWGSQSLAIQEDIDKGRYIIQAPHSNGYTYIYGYSIKGSVINQMNDTHKSLDAYGACNIIVNVADHAITLHLQKSHACIVITKYIKDTATISMFTYNHPINTDNTKGYLPVKNNSDDSIVNASSYISNSRLYITKSIDTGSDILKYFTGCYITPANNDQAPFIETYVDADGNTQEVNMSNGIYSNGDKYAKYFNLYKITIDYNTEEYYHDIIDIDWSSYPDANMWDTIDTASRLESYNKNVHFDAHQNYAGIHINSELFNIDNVNYIIVFATSENTNSYCYNKLISMVFTYDIDNNTATLIGKPYIKIKNDALTDSIYFIKKMNNDNTDWMITFEDEKFKGHQEIYRLQWNPIDEFIETNISDHWNERGLYIDKLNRIWGFDYNNVLWVGDINEEMKYEISLQDSTKIKWDGINDIINTINIRVKDLLGKLQINKNIIVKIIAPSNNVIFTDDTIETILTTNDIGIASTDIKIINEGDFEIIVDKDKQGV